MLIYFQERFRSFHTFFVESVGRRFAKALTVKIGDLKKKVYRLAIIETHVLPEFYLHWVCIILKIWWGEVSLLSLTYRPYTDCKKKSKSPLNVHVQEAGSILRVYCALSKWLHLNSGYLLVDGAVCFTINHFYLEESQIVYELLSHVKWYTME